jgi:importin-4
MRLTRILTDLSAVFSYQHITNYGFCLCRKVVASLCIGLAETINRVGPAILEGRLESIANIAVQILDGKAMCQQDPDQDEDEEAPEDTAEYDSILVSSAGDLVAALANALGADFAQAFNTFFTLISKYYVSVHL